MVVVVFDQMRKNNYCVHTNHQTVQEILDMNEECKTQRVGQSYQQQQFYNINKIESNIDNLKTHRLQPVYIYIQNLNTHTHNAISK